MNHVPRQPAAPGGRADDPRRGLLRTEAAGPEAFVRGQAAVPFLRHRRDGILPAVAGALSVRGATFTGTGSKADGLPALHPLVERFLDALPPQDRERHTGRCAETLLLSRCLTSVEKERSGRKAQRPLTAGEARKALKHARLTARHVREDGDPRHGEYAPPCRSCARLLDHFGVTAVDPGVTSLGASGAAAAGGEAG